MERLNGTMVAQLLFLVEKDIFPRIRSKNKMDIPNSHSTLKEKAFNKLFSSFFDKVVRFITSIVKSEDVALDIAQDVFLKLWENRDSIVESTVKSYLFVVAKNSALMYLRKKRIKEIFDSKDNTSQFSLDLDALYDAKEIFKKIKSCVMAMPEPRREIFILSRKRGMSNRDIAKKFNIEPKTVEYHITKALSELRKKCFR